MICRFSSNKTVTVVPTPYNPHTTLPLIHIEKPSVHFATVTISTCSANHGTALYTCHIQNNTQSKRVLVLVGVLIGVGWQHYFKYFLLPYRKE
jgi:hypothetical protein